MNGKFSRPTQTLVRFWSFQVAIKASIAHQFKCNFNVRPDNDLCSISVFLDWRQSLFVSLLPFFGGFTCRWCRKILYKVNESFLTTQTRSKRRTRNEKRKEEKVQVYLNRDRQVKLLMPLLIAVLSPSTILLSSSFFWLSSAKRTVNFTL